MDKGIELFDAYNIRARLSASIILLAPIAIGVFWADGESVRSIALSLGISEDACKKRIYRARDRFIKALESENDRSK